MRFFADWQQRVWKDRNENVERPSKAEHLKRHGNDGVDLRVICQGGVLRCSGQVWAPHQSSCEGGSDHIGVSLP